MIKLRYGYMLIGIITGFIFLFLFFLQLPDGRLHITACSVGQGDAIYFRFPGGRDMLIDAGPNNRVLGCLGKSMPFWDRTIDVVLLTHPEKDHYTGVQEILQRYSVGAFVWNGDMSEDAAFQTIMQTIAGQNVTSYQVSSGDTITIGSLTFSVLWPLNTLALAQTSLAGSTNLNDHSIVLQFSFGSFDALFFGDADAVAQPLLAPFVRIPTDGVFELVKVPHHGALTAFSYAFLPALPTIQTALISVGKNSYGHPAPSLVTALQSKGATVIRTDEGGDFHVEVNAK